MPTISGSVWMAKQSIYTIGGTVQAGGGIYIKRKADDELLELCRRGEFAFILSSRQVGKSSLMVRTAQQLEKENICSVTIDLSAIGINVSQDEWYLGILNEVCTALNLEADIFIWWSQFAQLGPALRLTNFFRDVLLREVKQPVVLFFDEIDSTLSVPFSDDFYIALRSVYNARSTTPDFKRLSFVLVGVAAPSDLISDSRRTPFNIGHRVELTDFTLDELKPLSEGLGENAEQVLQWVYSWTNGHPYLSQRVCAFIANQNERLSKEAVDIAVNHLFLGREGIQDNNLQFVRDMLVKRAADPIGVLKIYRQILKGKDIEDDEKSLNRSHLKLSGIVRRRQRALRVSNQIYQQIFDVEWVQDHLPRIDRRTVVLVLEIILGIGIVITLSVILLARIQESIARNRASGEMILLPEGPSIFGTEDPVLVNDFGAPPRQDISSLPAFMIGKYEVSNYQYGLCVKYGDCTVPLDQAQFRDPAMQDYPVVNVTIFQANAYCQWLGQRLPTQYEWERAARGPRMAEWPWGNHELTPQIANMPGNDNSPTGLQPVDSNPIGRSPEGIYNLVGNVSEWTSSFFVESLTTYDPTQFWDGAPETYNGNRLYVQRGGSWKLRVEDVALFTINQGVSASDDLGFRCAADVK
jgi:formylglycine-generating enzyme required for sulfatase activity